MFNTDDGFHIIVFDWKALLQGGSFRYYVLHTRNRYVSLRCNAFIT